MIVGSLSTVALSLEQTACSTAKKQMGPSLPHQTLPQSPWPGWPLMSNRVGEEQNSVWHWLHGAFVSLREPVWAQGPSTSSQE